MDIDEKGGKKYTRAEKCDDEKITDRGDIFARIFILANTKRICIVGNTVKKGLSLFVREFIVFYSRPQTFCAGARRVFTIVRATPREPECITSALYARFVNIFEKIRALYRDTRGPNICL